MKIDIIREMKLLAVIPMAAFVIKLVAHVFDCYAGL